MERIKKNLGFGCMRLPMKDGEVDTAEMRLTGILMAGPTAGALAFILSGAFCFKEIKKMDRIIKNAS